MTGRGHQLVQRDAFAAELEALGLDASIFGAVGVPAPIFQALQPRRSGVFDALAHTFGTKNEPTMFTRASVGMYRNAEGVWTQAANNVIRPHYTAAGTFCGYLFEPASTNVFLNSDAPATQSIALTTQDYTVSVFGTGSVTSSNGTGTATGHGAATEGSPVTITVTGAGTIVFTVAGAPTYVNVEGGGFSTTPIITAGTPASRALDTHAIVQPPEWIDAPYTLLIDWCPLFTDGQFPINSRLSLVSLLDEPDPAIGTTRTVYYQKTSGGITRMAHIKGGNAIVVQITQNIDDQYRICVRADAAKIYVSVLHAGSWLHGSLSNTQSLNTDGTLRIGNQPWAPHALKRALLWDHFFSEADVERLFS